MRVGVDRGLLLVVLFLIGVGLVQVYTASFIFAIESYDDGLFFVKKQALFALVGVATSLLVAFAPFRWIRTLGLGLWGFSALAVLATLIPGLGVKVGGAHRWLPLFGGLRLEPGEFLKISTPFFMAFAIDRMKRPSGETWRNHLALLAAFSVPLLGLLRQPDFGSFMIIVAVSFAIVFANGLKWRYVIAGVVSVVGAAVALILAQPYRLARVVAFLDPWADPGRKGFQVIQSLLGFHSGGLTGAGLGAGQGKLFFLPEAHTDFTLAVLGEELGFLGIVAVLVLAAFVVLRGLQISVAAPNDTSRNIGLGLILTFATNVVVNAGVAMGLLPTKGLGFPFLSYGGSSLIAMSFAVGVLLNIDRSATLEKRKNYSGIRIHN